MTLGPSDDPLAAVELVVMARVPIVGAVKTRLARSIGAANAHRLYRAWVSDLAAKLSRLPAQVTWLWTPAGADHPDLGLRAQHGTQCDGDLGVRMTAAIARQWNVTARPVIVLGVDAPHLDVEWLRTGARCLQAGTDVVIGPADDGGYWTIGVRAPLPFLFEDVPWGTGKVFASTMDRIRACGASSVLLPRTFDVDEWDDLCRLRAHATAQPTMLPATTAVLAELAW